MGNLNSNEIKMTVKEWNLMENFCSPRRPNSVYFKSDDDKYGMKISLELIVNEWLDNLSPERLENYIIEENKRIESKDEERKLYEEFSQKLKKAQNLFSGEQLETKLDEIYDEYHSIK